ncbi:MAG: NADH-quinone oxidoreductase subunit C [Eubacterium sp.]|nr:NADH-quinone oxidoreductase subunit C [Eubacterium sp.]
MQDLGQDIIKLEKDEFLPEVQKKRNENWRLGQICCAFVDGTTYEVSYSFCKDLEVVHFRLEVGKDEEVLSISRIYDSAVFYENEMHELFGLNVTNMVVDCQDKLYRIKETTPFVKKEEK